jgi:uncharacterized protein YdaU (DUF1376 family)
MNPWYAHYLGDYRRDTAHLSLVEHGAYRLLLDHCYSTESPLPAGKDALYRICSAVTDVERAAVDSVLTHFFKVGADGYRNARADREIVRRAEQRRKLSDAGRRGGKKSRRAPQASLKPGLSEASSQAEARPQPQPQKAKAAAAPLFSSTESVWVFLGIQPCGPLRFRELLEDRWASRNGGPYSTLIGETVNAWEAAEQEKPRHCAPLFQALEELRVSEARTGDDIVRLESWQ